MAVLRTSSRTAVALALTLLFPACGKGGSDGVRLGPGGRGPAGRGVLLIVADGLRADHVAEAGYDRDTTPFLDALAAEGVSFRQAYSTAPWLMPAHVSVVTGCDPFVALRFLPEDLTPTMAALWKVPEDAPRLAREFLRKGYATAAFSDHPWFSPVHGFDSGFQSFFDFPLGPSARQTPGVEGTAKRFKQWLLGRPREKNWFAYVHLHDLERAWNEADPAWFTLFEARPELDHLPPLGAADHLYDAVPQRRWPGGLLTLGQYEIQYDGAIRRLDAELGKLFLWLEGQERWGRTTVVVVGSYGMGLGEARVILDHGTLTDVDLHVPLIVRPRGGLEGPQVRSQLASIMDVAPTLLDLEGLAVPHEMHGVSLAPAMRDPVLAPRRNLVARCGFQSGYVVMDERWCYERTQPWAVRDSALVLSWYGRADPADRVAREVLHDRRRGSDPGHRGVSPLDPELVARLRGVADGLLATFDGARREYQRVDWPSPPEEGMSGNLLPGGGSPTSPP